MTDTELNNLRKQLWANGYFPVPNLSKKCVLPGWNAKGFYARELKRYKGDANAMLDSWSVRHERWRSTGVRMEKELGGIDGDVDDEGLMSILVGILKAVVPEVEQRAPLRFGSGTHKATWFVRVLGEQFTRIATRDYVRNQAELDAWEAAIAVWKAAGAAGVMPAEPKYHHVEIFGDGPDKKGNCHRQCGVFGWNAEPGNKEGKPVAAYSWADQSLLDVPLVALPVLTKAQAWEIVKQFETAAEAAGWVARPPQESAGAGCVFDIDRATTVFATAAYGAVKYAELEALVQAHGSVRCNPSFAGLVSPSDDRCNAIPAPQYGCVAVHDFGGAIHLPNDIPHGDLKGIADKMEKIKERAQQQQQEPPEEPPLPKDGGAPPAADGGGGVLTHDRVALAFAELMGESLRYCHDAGSWFAWAGTHWQGDRTEMALHLARELSRQMSKGMTKASALKEARSVGFARSVNRFAASDPKLAVTSAHWDQDGYLMGTPDGTLDLRTGLVRPADPADGISKLTAVAPERMKTPLWDEFLKQTFKNDPELIKFNQRWFGYSLTGDICEHALWFGSGSGGNGKGVMLNTIHWLMGDYARTAPMDMFTAKTHDSHPTDLAMLRGARLVTASETEEGRAWAESRIKQMTGGDPISARFMRQDFFTYLPQFKLSLIGNHNPRLKNIDDAVRRRFNLVPFLNQVPKEKQDQQLQEKLKGEGPGIMQWLVDGCLSWQEVGLKAPEAVKEATKKYFDEQDLIGQWLEEYYQDSKGATVAHADLFRSWSIFAQGAGADPGLQRQLTTELERRGYEAGKSGSVRHIKGLKVKTAETEKPKPKPDLHAVKK